MTVLGSAVDLILGAAGTVLYLSAWNRALAGQGTSVPDQDDAGARRHRRRRRLVQLVFFLLLTPYVLALFRLMALVRALVEGSPETGPA